MTRGMRARKDRPNEKFVAERRRVRFIAGNSPRESALPCGWLRQRGVVPGSDCRSLVGRNSDEVVLLACTDETVFFFYFPPPPPLRVSKPDARARVPCRVPLVSRGGHVGGGEDSGDGGRPVIRATRAT